MAEPSTNVPLGNVTVETAKQLLKTESPPIVLDVRTAKEFAEGHIEGAKNIDVKAENFKELASKLKKDAAYLIHCKSGGRSAKALKILTDLGFTKMYHMHEGYLAWTP